MLLFSTPHGSHLYGTAHADSDSDTFEVYINKIGRVKARNAKQKINEYEDAVWCDLSTFTQYAKRGVPQYLEAMYSRMATVDVLGEPFRYSFRPDLWEAIHTYRRTITSFYERGVEEDNDKFRRHAWRLFFNLLLIEQGKVFNPTLNQTTLDYINSVLDVHPLEQENVLT